ncbi:hypothetical protein P7K49_037607, partial [Saguinus oedipus]
PLPPLARAITPLLRDSGGTQPAPGAGAAARTCPPDTSRYPRPPPSRSPAARRQHTSLVLGLERVAAAAWSGQAGLCGIPMAAASWRDGSGQEKYRLVVVGGGG